MHWSFLLTAIATSVVGQGLLKAGAGEASVMEQLTNWRTVIGLAIYGGSALLYILALRRIPLTVALPCTALSYLAVALVGHFAFNEAFSLQRGIALALISAGVLVLATS